jgi:coenzyme F420-reducing hydrogenase delta subunit
MAYCSSAEGQKFQKVAIEFDKEIKSMGHNPLGTSSDTQKKN